MSRYAREEIMSSSEVVRNFGAVLSSVVQHKREKIAIMRNNRLEAVIVAADVYDRMDKACEAAMTSTAQGSSGNSADLLNFLRESRLAAPLRLSSEEIDQQVRAEREAWE